MTTYSSLDKSAVVYKEKTTLVTRLGRLL